MLEDKLQKLDNILRELEPVIIAFSGGVDSSFLLYRANRLMNDKVLAVTITTPYIPQREVEEALSFARNRNIRHKIIKVEFPVVIKHNPVERCYLCKKLLFNEIISFSRSNGFPNIIDGTNADDTGDFRPGMKALKEMGVRSPLLEAGLTKDDIRQACRNAGLELWDKPAMACLLTRIPYDTEINEETLRMIEAGEDLLFEKGFPGTRVRVHGDVARIECMPGYIEKIINAPNRESIITSLKKIGFRYVSLDLEGYRTGSLNPEKQSL